MTLSNRMRDQNRHDPVPGLATPPFHALWIALVLAAAGLAVALWLAQLQVEAHSGIRHGCTIEGTSFDCDKVATSEYSVVLGLPVAIWGAFGYGLVCILTGWGLIRRRSRATWPLGLLWVAAAAAVAASVVLAGVSELLIGAWCTYCMTVWALAVALLITVWWAARRAGGIAAVIGADFSSLRAHPFWTLAAAVGALVVVGVTKGQYDRGWRPVTSQPRTAPAPANTPVPANITYRDAQGKLTVIEYSDYECPACLNAHERNRVLLSDRTDVTLVRRQFPLDSACNPMVKGAIHPNACRLARAAICAEAQGRFEDMDHALFRNQREHLPLVELARRLGLDLNRFNECLDSAQTTQRLAEDINAAVSSGVHVTPSYVIGGATFSGELPPGIFSSRR